MIRDSMIPLESYRLAQLAGQVECYICGEPNSHETEVCNRCSAPLALAQQAESQQTPPQLVGVIGASGVGKTVFLGMLLDMLSRQPDRMQMLARGAFSISLQQAAVSALSRCEFPAKTPNEPDRWNWVHCQVQPKNRRRPVNVIVPDMAGESLLEEVDHPFSYTVVRSFLTKCSSALILIDTTKLRDGREQDYYAMKLLSYLMELEENPKKGWRSRPIALVLTKADECEDAFLDPSTFAKTHAAGLWQHCTERFKNARFFASGVAGTCAERVSLTEGATRVPLRIEPRGIIEPFEWLIESLK